MKSGRESERKRGEDIYRQTEIYIEMEREEREEGKMERDFAVSERDR